MSNLGLERRLKEAGLTLARSAVGDRYVMEMMRGQGFNLGGEQSGHLILSDYSTTGDGLLAALQVLDLMVAKERDAASLLQVFDPVPQLLKNTRFEGANPLDTPAVQQSIQDASDKLGDSGRVLVRKSGTEPKIRVMAEGDHSDQVNAAVDSILDAIETAKASNQAAE